MPSVKLSAVIITFNEERNIGRCIDSVKDVCDEVLVVDSFSQDKTAMICAEKGARFIQHPFEGHIEQKNYAVSQAMFDHILSLDADEALDDELKKSVLRLKESWNENAAYSLNRLTNYCGSWIRYGTWYPDVKVRLFDRRKSKWAGTNPHDRLEPGKGVQIEHIKGDLLHYSYYSYEEHLQQVNKFTSILAKSYLKEGRRAGMDKLLINPWAYFIKYYILHRGFLDGYHGFVIAVISMHATFMKYVKLRKLKNDKTR